MHFTDLGSFILIDGTRLRKSSIVQYYSKTCDGGHFVVITIGDSSMCFELDSEESARDLVNDIDNDIT